MNPLQALLTDLTDAGVPALAAAAVCADYETALIVGSGTAWVRFYRRLFAALQELGEPSNGGRCVQARRSLLQIVEDDLGCELFPNGLTGPELRAARPQGATRALLGQT